MEKWHARGIHWSIDSDLTWIKIDLNFKPVKTAPSNQQHQPFNQVKINMGMDCQFQMNMGMDCN